MEAVVEDLRAKLRAGGAGAVSRDLPESRLELACAWGSGHVLVTGSDRKQVDGLLDRVIRKVEPMGTVRASAGDPSSTVDRLIALLDSEKEVTGHLDRRRALLQLVARAQEARKSIFVVVDDADAATVEQLERLRATLEVAPDAIERLRMVLVGDVTLPAKLDNARARALSSRITSRIRVGDRESGPLSVTFGGDRTARAGSSASMWAFAVATAMSFAVISYATVLLLSAPESDRFERIASLLPTIGADASSELAPVVTWQALNGDERFLDSSLEIRADSRWVTGSALFALPSAEPAKEAVVAAAPLPPVTATVAPTPAPAAVSSPNPARKRTVSSIQILASLIAKRSALAQPAKPAAAQQADAPSVGSSIAALRSRFK